jgi:hypothetical protein
VWYRNRLVESLQADLEAGLVDKNSAHRLDTTMHPCISH